MSEIIEISHFFEVLDYVSSECWVLLGVDNTLINPKQMIGTDDWLLARYEKKTKQGMAPHLAFESALSEQEAIRQLMQVELVEKGSDEVVLTLQDQGLVVLGITPWGLATATRTVHLLQGVNIDLGRNSPHREDLYFLNGTRSKNVPSEVKLHKAEGVLFRHGILFTAGTHKGMAICKLCELCQQIPKKIVFLHHAADPLNDVKNSLTPLGIKFVGLRYNINDQKKYRPDIAEAEWERSTLAHLLSDQEIET